MDTSALMMPVECDVRVFEELARLLGAGAAPSGDAAADADDTPAGTLDLVVPAAVRAELASLSQGSGEEATAARVGADLAARCRTVETDASYADDALVELAERGEAGYVVTNDRPLRDRLLERGVRVIGLRGGDKLAVTRP